jgi:hypothetical protein
MAVAVCAAVTGLAQAEVVQKGDIRVNFDGQLWPKALPRAGETPVRVLVGAKVTALKESDPPRLRKITIAINRAGKLAPGALPICTIQMIQPSTNKNALKVYGRSLVGTGRFAAKVLLPQQASFPTRGKLFAFNGRYEGRSAILAHVFGTEPSRPRSPCPSSSPQRREN